MSNTWRTHRGNRSISVAQTAGEIPVCCPCRSDQIELAEKKCEISIVAVCAALGRHTRAGRPGRIGAQDALQRPTWSAQIRTRPRSATRHGPVRASPFRSRWQHAAPAPAGPGARWCRTKRRHRNEPLRRRPLREIAMVSISPPARQRAFDSPEWIQSPYRRGACRSVTTHPH